MGCTRSPFSGGLRCCAFGTGPVNPDVIWLPELWRQTYSRMLARCMGTHGAQNVAPARKFPGAESPAPSCRAAPRPGTVSTQPQGCIHSTVLLFIQTQIRYNPPIELFKYFRVDSLLNDCRVYRLFTGHHWQHSRLVPNRTSSIPSLKGCAHRAARFNVSRSIGEFA